MVKLIGNLEKTRQVEITPNASGDVALKITNPSAVDKLKFDAEGRALVDLDMNNKDLKNVNVTRYAPTTEPVTPSEGYLYYDDTAHALRVRKASAFYTIGSSDTTVNKADFTAKGQILVGTGSGTFTAVGVGTDNQVLTADALASSGVKWANASGDITDVTAGDGLQGGGSSGNVTLALDLSTVSGLSLVGTSPDKTLEIADSLAGTGLQMSSKVLSIDSTVVTLTGSQTLTNKTLTTPTIGSFVNSTHNHENATGGGTLSITNATTGTLTETRGGTGQSSYITGQILYASASDTLSKLAVGTAGQVLTVAGGVPTWATAPSGTITEVIAGDGLSGGGSSGSITLSIDLATTSGLELVGTTPDKELALADSVAGTGLQISSKVISVSFGGDGSATTVARSDHSHSTYVLKAGDTMTGTLAMGTNKVTSSYVPVNAVDLVNKSYVDNIVTGLAWKAPAVVVSLVGNATVATINGLGIVAGNAYVVTDSGTLTRGSVAVVAGDMVEDNGTDWVKVVSNSGGFIPSGTRAILSTTTALISPYTDATDDGKVVSFSGSSNTGTDTGDATNYSALLIQNATHDSYYENIGFTFEGTVPTGSWIQFTGAGTINAGVGLVMTGNTINVNLGAGIKELPTDQIGIDLSAVSGLELTGTGAGDTLQIADTIAGNGLSITSKVLAVGAGTGITVGADTVSINQGANLTWTGTHNFTSTFQLNSISLTATATEINQALDGISANVTYTNLNTLTAGSSSNADSLHTHTGLAKQYTQGFTAQTSVVVNHNLGKYPIVQVIDASGYWFLPGDIQHTSVNSFTMSFASSTTGTIVYIG